MHPNLSTTPHGRRPLSLAMVASQITAQECPPHAVADKWEVLDTIRVAAATLGLSHQRIAVLSALMSFHPGAMLAAERNIIVFPSNARLAERANGMSEATVRRHIAGLVDAGLIIRRDSPNGKRYTRKGQGGAIRQAFGFELTPLIARAAEFKRLAAEVLAEREELKRLRQCISISQRDIRKMLDAVIDERIPGDWAAFRAAYAPLSTRMSRAITLSDAAIFSGALDQLVAQIRNIMESHVKTHNISGNAAQNERHIQNSNTHPKIESEPGQPKSQGATSEPLTETPSPPQRSYPLGMILEACPDIATYARNGIGSWRDLVATAALVRSYLDISPSAWEDAKDVLGPEDAAVVVAAILQRSDAIKSPGGYLRSLIEKARGGAFSLGPVLMALIRTNLRNPSRKRA
jgi:replication initiation protein RepC